MTNTKQQRAKYLEMTERLGRRWVGVFNNDKRFYSAAYWDLLTGLWRSDEPVRKTDAYGLMTAIRSSHTASKYLEEAITAGIIIESDDSNDKRSKLLSLSDEMKRRLDGFFDDALVEIKKTAAATQE